MLRCHNYFGGGGGGEGQGEIVWFGYLQLIGPQSLGSIIVVSLCVLLLI